MSCHETSEGGTIIPDMTNTSFQIHAHPDTTNPHPHMLHSIQSSVTGMLLLLVNRD